MDKFKNNKQLIGLISITFVVVIAIVLIVVGKSLASVDSSILRNQKVDGLSFENGELVCETGICTFTVDVYNENQDTYRLKSININFKQEDNSVVTLVGYIGEILETEEGRKVTASIDKDISNSVDLKYSINN